MPNVLNRYLRLFLIILLWWLFSGLIKVTAQNENGWKIQHISIEQGLSNRFVNHITTDSRGYIWISTNFGLNRYDGQHVDILTRESHHLNTNTMFELEQDINQNIWVVHRDVSESPVLAIDVLDPISFAVQPLKNYVRGPIPFELKDIRRIVSDSSHALYIVTFLGNVYHFDGHDIKHIIQNPDATHGLELAIGQDYLLTIVNGEDSINVWTKDGNWLSRHPLPKTKDLLSTEVNWRSLGSTTGDQQLFVSINSAGNLVHYVLANASGFTSLYHYPAAGPTTLCTYDVYRKLMWVNDTNGFHTLDPVSDASGLPIPFDLNDLRSMQCDGLGLIWICTQNGIFLASKKPKYFHSLNVQIPTISCRGFAEDREGNIYSFTLSGEFTFSHDGLKSDQPPVHNNWFGLAAITDSENQIWFSKESCALTKYSPVTGEYTDYDIPNHKPVYYACWSLRQIQSGMILMGSMTGLWVKDPHDANPVVHFDKLNGYTMLDQSNIYNILETKEGIWLSTDNGLYLVDMDKGVLEHIDEETSDLPNNNILFLHKDADGIYWLSSRGGGLIRWDRAKNAFRSFTVNEGLSHNIIYAIYEDDYGFLWMPSDYGLMRFEKSTGICRTFLVPDGLPHEEFNRASYFKDRDGNMYFGGLNGFVTFHPKDFLQVHALSLPIQLTKFEAINEQTGETEDLTNEASFLAEIKLKPSISSFIIRYAILDYDDPQLKRYAYRIDGLNTNWTYLKENFIRINGLKGGSYTIRIKGQSSTGQWSKNELVIPVTILKPFVVRWYSQAFLLILLLLLLYFIYKKRNQLQKQRLQREMDQLRQVDKLKDQFLANTSHELRTPLNGIVGLSEFLLEKTNVEEDKENLELIISSGRRLSSLVNDILDFSRLKEHDLQLNLKPVDIRTIADLCLRMNRHLLQGKNLLLENQIPENITYCLADENRLQQVLQNLVANAVKFTREGSVKTNAHEENGMMIISVADTGIGIEKEKQAGIFKEFEQADGSIGREFGGTGLGLSISKYLVELHGGEISVASVPGQGSVFTFSIPLYKGDTSQIEKEKSVSGIRLEKELQQKPNLTNPTIPVNGKAKDKRNILIVDDEPVNLKVLQNHLEHAGYAVTLAHDGQEALTLLEKNAHFHLVLLDVMMPRISGYEVCQKIRQRHLSAELPVIMITAKNQVNDLVEGFDMGANDYIVKPFSKDELLARVKAQLDNYGIHEATNRFVPHEFIRSLGRESIMDLQRGDMVEQHVHVMFSDIRDYTALAEDMTPRENFKFVNKLAGEVGPIVKANHGMINQYLGDTIMMLYMQKADHAVNAGAEILHMIRDFNLKAESKSRKPIKLGLGLHSGPLMMGIIGDSMRTDAAVISDTVNTASRMEGITKYFNVNFIVSEDTVQKLEDRDRFHLRYLGKVQAKGKTNSLKVYECFDGDTADQIQAKLHSLQNFHDGMNAFFDQDMMLARKYFDLVYQANPMDATALGFLHKIHGYLSQGIPDGWTGVEVMQNK